MSDTATHALLRQQEGRYPPADLAASIRRAVRDAIYPSLDEARKLIGEAGVDDARVELRRALDALDAAQAEHREAKAAERAAAESHDQAVLDAEWALDGRFVTEGRTTYLVSQCTVRHWPAGDGTAPECPECSDTGEVRKAMTADERKAWKAAEARKTPEVATAAEFLRRAVDRTLAARDAVNTAERRINACQHDLDATVAALHALAAGLAAGRGA